MVKCIKETINTVKELEWESFSGVMAQLTRANLKTILSKEKGNAHGLTVRLTMANGRKVNRMEKESRYFQVEIDTMDSTKRIKSTALVS